MKANRMDAACLRALKVSVAGDQAPASLVVGGRLESQDEDAAFMAEFADVARRAGEASGLSLVDVTFRDERGRVVGRWR